MSDDSDDNEPMASPAPASGVSRPLLALGLVLALGATVALVFSDSVRWLRLGVIAALWAALAGAFIAAKFRRDAGARDDEIDNLHHVYELELEREVAARREHELEIEAEAVQKVQADTSAQLSALRTELNTLRQHLETLLGGELLVERVALHAESTRMRSIPENPHQQAPAVRAEAQPKPVTARRPANELPTERRRLAAEQNGSPAERTMRADPVRTEYVPEPARAQCDAAAAEPAIGQDQTSTVLWPAQPRNGSPAEPNGNGRYLPGEPFVANAHGSNGHAANGDGNGDGNGYGRNGNRNNGDDHAPVIDPNWTPSWESDSQRLRAQRSFNAEAAREAQRRREMDPRGSQRRAEADPVRGSQRLHEPEPSRGSRRLDEAEPAYGPQRPGDPAHGAQRFNEPEPMRGSQRSGEPGSRRLDESEPVRGSQRMQDPSRRLDEPEPDLARGSQRLPEPMRGPDGPDSVRAEHPAPRIREPEPARAAGETPPSQPPPSSTFAAAAFEPAEPPARTAAKTQLWEPVPDPAPEHGTRAESGGGRRRRPENVSFTESFGAEQPTGRHGGGHGGSHARPQPSRPVSHAQPEAASHRKEPAPAQDSGAHAAGRAVSDLLAANGQTDGPRRRRRRED